LGRGIRQSDARWGDTLRDRCMQVHFSSNTLAEIFRDLYMSERQGVLSLVHDEVEKRVYFDRGLIVHAESDLDEDDLGRRLAEAGQISSGALNEARQAIDDGGDLASTLLARDLVGRETLLDALQEHISGVVRSVFHWEGGEARFEDAEPPAAEFEPDTLKTCKVVLDGVHAMSNFGKIHDALVGLDRNLKLRTPATLPVDRLGLSPTEGFVLSRVDGETSVKEIVSILPPSDDDRATRFLYGLLVMGVLEFDPPVSDGLFRVANLLRDHTDRNALESMQERTIRQAYESTLKTDPREVLGVDSDADSRVIDGAYEAAKAMFSEDRLLPSIAARFKSELTVIESRLIEAYLKLSQSKPNERPPTPEVAPAVEDGKSAGDLVMRVEMDKAKSKIEHEKMARTADDYFQQARKALREADFHNAIQYAKLAISYNDAEAEYFFVLAECQARNPGGRWQHMAEQNFTRASKLDPWNADYLVRLGIFYKKRGLQTRARKQFEEALRLSPQHEQATVELNQLP